MKETLNLSISGEGNSIANIVVTSSNNTAINKSFTYNLNQNGELKLKKQQGFTGGNKLNMIRHPLGTIMISTLTDKLENASNSNIYTSPPGYCPFFNEYQINEQSPFTKFNSYTKKSTNSISFVQQGTAADQFPLGNTAKYTVSINAPDVPVCGNVGLECGLLNMFTQNSIANKHNTNPKMVNQILFNRQSVEHH